MVFIGKDTKHTAMSMTVGLAPGHGGQEGSCRTIHREGCSASHSSGNL